MQQSAPEILNEEIIIDLFESYKIRADGILATCSLVREDSRLEVVPLQFALANYIYSTAGADGRLFRSYAMRWAHRYARDFAQEKVFYARLDFYSDILHGRAARGEWVFGMADDLEENPVLRCLVAFGDILINPACVKDYDNAHAARHDTVPVLGFARDTMTGIISLYDDFCDQIADVVCPNPDSGMDFLTELQYAVAYRTDDGMESYLKRVAPRASQRQREFINQVLCEEEDPRSLVLQKITELTELRNPTVKTPESGGADKSDVKEEGVARKPLADRMIQTRMAWDAIGVYRKLTEARPSADAFCDLGSVCLDVGRYFLARDAFRKALDIDQDDGRALENLAYAQVELLDYEAAAETLERSLELHHDEAALTLWRQCRDRLRIQNEKGRAFRAKNPDAPPPAHGLPRDVDIDWAIDALREAGEDVDQMNDREILFLYEARYRPESRPQAGGN